MGSQPPATGLFSMQGGCHAAGGAAVVVFIVVHGSHSTAERAKPGGVAGSPWSFSVSQL